MAKQPLLPGTGTKRIEELEAAASSLRTIRAQRSELQKEEEKAQQLLRDLLKKHGFRINKPYQFEEDVDGETIKLDVVIEQKEARAYVRKHKDENEEAPESEGEETEA